MEPQWVEDVLDFWFTELGEAHWFSKNDAVDAEIRRRFLALHEQFRVGDCHDVAGPRASLAAVILLDQFSRNMFRNSPRAYDADPLARRLARDTIAHGHDATMTDRERLFLYLPFEHSEDPEDQALAVKLIAQLGNDEWTRYALAHKAIIDRFGRFPHRNAVLGRTSSAEELELLKDPMGSF
jgi:uncharacterized protein (DUF924 family)